MAQLKTTALTWAGAAVAVLAAWVLAYSRSVASFVYNHWTTSIRWWGQLLPYISNFLLAVSATLLCTAIALPVWRWAQTEESRVRDDEWRRQIILVEIDEPSPQDPPSTDAAQVRLAALYHWFHACLIIAIVFIVPGVLLWSNVGFHYVILPPWLDFVAQIFGRLGFIIGVELLLALIIVRALRNHNAFSSL